MLTIEEIIENDEFLEVGRKAIENRLIELRDSRICLFTRNNGLVIREYDGSNSNVIRMGSEGALRVGLKAILEHVKEQE